MTLPGSRRPPELQKELEEEREEIEKAIPITKTISRVEVILNSLLNWYNHLSSRKRAVFTDEDLKWKMLGLCDYLNYSYDNLPLDWVRRAQERGLSFVRKKQILYQKAMLREEEEENKADYGIEDETEEKVVPTRMSERLVQNTIKRSALEAQLDAERASKKPKMIYEMDVPPPSWWLEGKQLGQRMQRTLKHYYEKETHAIIMFYDYGLKHEQLKKMKIEPGVGTVETIQAHPSLLHLLPFHINAFDFGDANDVFSKH